MSDRINAQHEIGLIANRGDAAIDRLTADLGKVTAAAIERYSIARPDGTKRITRRGYKKIMAAVDAEIARIYGKRRGDTSAPMYTAIAAASTAANDAGARRVSTDVRRRLRKEPELLAALTEPE